MPAKDGRGPRGQGPRTGRGLGDCKPSEINTQDNKTFGRGQGLGPGRGQGFGPGRGQGSGMGPGPGRGRGRRCRW